MELGIILGLVGLLGALYGGWRKVRPSVRLWLDARDVIAGREPVFDRGGNVSRPGQPGLAHWMGNMEAATNRLADVIADQQAANAVAANHETRLTALEAASVDHDATLAALIGGTFERGAENILTAVERANADAIDVESDEP